MTSEIQELPQLPDIPDYAFPPYARSAAERERWRLAIGIATEISRQNEPDGVPSSQFVWYFARTLYFSEIETGSPADAAVAPRQPS